MPLRQSSASSDNFKEAIGARGNTRTQSTIFFLPIQVLQGARAGNWKGNADAVFLHGRTPE
jgi:hypothetical protein